MTTNHAIVRLRSRLIARRDALRKTLRSEVDSFQMSERNGVGDTDDAAFESVNDEIRSQLVAIESRELGRIERALHRIDLGVYGRCETCGAKIPVARLNAMPYTTKCIRCEYEGETRGKTGPSARNLVGEADAYERPIAADENNEEIDRGDFKHGFRTLSRLRPDQHLVAISQRQR